MLTPFTLEYPLPPVFHTADTLELAAAYGIGREQPPYTVARDFSFPYQPGELVLLSGPSGSGKSSVLRELARQLRARNLDDTPLPDGPILSAWPGTLAEKLDWASAVGLAEPRLLLRQPCELSEGQKDRFRLATALAQLAKPNPESSPGLARLFWVDELAARLDRVTAKVLVYNLQKLLRRQGIGLLAATTHEDLLEDLNPDWHLDCRGDGDIRVTRRAVKKKAISFATELTVGPGTRADWPRFARWHYRSHHLGFVRRVILLRHGALPIGIVVFSTPAATVYWRSVAFGLVNPSSSVHLAAMNEQIWSIQRLVLDPRYRGASLATAFLRVACRLCPARWIETLSALGQMNPVFERAGFRRYGVSPRRKSRRSRANDPYREAQPVYFLRENDPGPGDSRETLSCVPLLAGSRNEESSSGS